MNDSTGQLFTDGDTSREKLLREAILRGDLIDFGMATVLKPASAIKKSGGATGKQKVKRTIEPVPEDPQKSAAGKKRKPRILSAETRKKMSDSQKAAWAEVSPDLRKTLAANYKARAKKDGKGELSEEGRARIVAAQKARWAAFKKSKKA